MAGEKENAIEPTEQRLHDEMVDLFWLTVFGLGLILGGVALMKAVKLGDILIVAYMILSSTAFTINFALSLWQIRRLAGMAKEEKHEELAGRLDTNELPSAEPRIAIEAAPSVVENTTRNLDQTSKESVAR
ncbi:MAG: hypothetical protein ABI977_27520 [Acidobacteriota bacterium]